MTLDFQVNDKVRYHYNGTDAHVSMIDDATWSEYTGTVTQVDGGVLKVNWHFNRQNGWDTDDFEADYPTGGKYAFDEEWIARHIKRVSFRVGDDVEIVNHYENYPHSLNGERGKLISIDDGSMPYQVRLDSGDDWGWWVFKVKHFKREEIVVNKTPADIEADIVEDRMTEEIEQLKAELAVMREQHDDLAVSKRRAIEARVTADAALEEFRQRVFTVLNDRGVDDLTEIAEELDLEEFLKDRFSLTVTLTIPAEKVSDYLGMEKMDDVSDSNIADLLYDLSRSDLYYYIDGFETNDER